MWFVIQGDRVVSLFLMYLRWQHKGWCSGKVLKDELVFVIWPWTHTSGKVKTYIKEQRCEIEPLIWNLKIIQNEQTTRLKVGIKGYNDGKVELGDETFTYQSVGFFLEWYDQFCFLKRCSIIVIIYSVRNYWSVLKLVYESLKNKRYLLTNL